MEQTELASYERFPLLPLKCHMLIEGILKGWIIFFYAMKFTSD